ncbi:MAG: right-handed parallel beta-helix repeat-containing protein [Pirellulales bacterium]
MRFDWLSSKKPDRRTLAVRGRPVTAFFRPLRFEPLEDRRLLSITVNTLFDENDGIGVGGVSLREAIVAAMPGETIDFSVTGTINLSSLGQLTINKDLTINGPGANLLTIRAFDPNATVGNGTHVFSVDDGNFTADKTIAISGLTITGGDAVASGNFTAGAIQSFENLSITASTITGNRVTGGPGGGIWQYGGSLTISASTISGNTSTRGGGIYAFNAVNVVVSAGTISGNTATSTFGIGGGGIVNNNGTLTVTNSTISGNSTNANGGGIHNNSFFGSLTVRHSTITGNRADADNNGSGRGGGVYDRYGTASIDHTIAAGNVRSVSTRDDVGGGAVSARYSLIGDGTGATITDNGGNQIGTGGAPIDPLLGPLTDNGGPAQTHALLAGSPAIDMGDPAFTAPPTEDQRGAPFVRVVVGDGSGGARIDIGAYERQTLVGPQALVVDTIVDEWDGNFSAGDLSLREALALANHTVGAGTISFAAALTSGGPATILLMRGELAISDALTINGPGASLLTIDASGNDPTPDLRFGDGSRVFRIDDALSTILLDVEIHGLTLTGGDVSGPGGTIFAAENLTIADSIITGNRGEGGVASTVVGEIYSSNGATSPNSLTVLDSTIRDSSGGAIRKIEGSLVIERSSILTNQAIVGAGVSATGVSVNVQIRESTLAGNVAANRGGGMFLDGGSATLVNTTISNNGTQAIGANGSGLYISSGAAVLRHCTITRNDFGGDNRASGIVARGDTGATIQVYSSIIAGNSFFFGFADVVFVNGVNPFQSLGYNVVGAGSGRDAFSAATNDQPGVVC